MWVWMGGGESDKCSVDKPDKCSEKKKKKCWQKGHNCSLIQCHVRTLLTGIASVRRAHTHPHTLIIKIFLERKIMSLETIF